MKIALFADKEVGHAITKYLMEKYTEDLSLVVTVDKNEIFDLAVNLNIQTSIFELTDSFSSKFPKDIDLGILAWWPYIIKEPLLTKPKNGFINTHPSYLPYNRGKHYNFWAIVEQCPFGVSIHRVEAGIDNGSIIVQKEIPYDWTDTGGTLYSKAQSAMVDLFCETYPLLREGNYQSKPQNTGIGSYHHSSELDKASNIHLDDVYCGRDLLNLLRARTFKGHPGCWFEEDGSRFEITIDIRRIE